MKSYLMKRMAEQYFVEQGLMPKKEDRTERWVLHHIDTTLKEKDPKRYAEWRIEDLMPCTCAEHMRIHGTERCDAKTRQIMREKKLGIPKSESHRANMSEAIKRKYEENPDYNRHSSSIPVQIKCLETGEIYKSRQALVKVLGCSYAEARKIDKGPYIINGLTYEKVSDE